MCEDVLIGSENGVIQSRAYPKYLKYGAEKDRGCVAKILVPEGKTIDIWIEDMAIKDRSPARK